VHASAFETGADDGLALGFDHACGDAQAEGAESWIVHSGLIVGKVIEALACRVAGGSVGAEF